jgi:hypothetical protein
MGLLDTGSANVALPHISDGLATSYDESTWVLTLRRLAQGTEVALPLAGAASFEASLPRLLPTVGDDCLAGDSFGRHDQEIQDWRVCASSLR